MCVAFPNGGFGAVRGADFREERVDELLDARLADPELSGDVPIGEPAREGLKHFDLPRRELRDGRLAFQEILAHGIVAG